MIFSFLQIQRVVSSLIIAIPSTEADIFFTIETGNDLRLYRYAFHVPPAQNCENYMG